MEQEFYVLKDEDGNYFPMAFISVADMAGEMRREEYEKKKIAEGETIVKIKIVEV